MVVEDRIATTMKSGKDDGRGDLREIKGLFERLDMNAQYRRPSEPLDPSYVNSHVGMVQAASLVSTPEDGSSNGSFSPKASISEAEKGKQGSRSRKTSRASVAESPLMQTKGFNDSRMDNITEERK